MFAYLTLVALLFGQADGNDVRVHIPKEPFECAHARCFCFDSAGRRLVCATQRGELLIWNENAETPQVIALERRPQDDVLNRGPSSLVLATRDEAAVFFHNGRAELWNINRGKKVKDLMSDRSSFGYAHVSPDGGLVGVLSYSRNDSTSAIVLWTTRDWSNVGKIETRENIDDFCFSPDGRQVITCVGHATDQKDKGFTGIIAWNLASKEIAAKIEFGSGFPVRIAISPDGRWVATGGGDAIPSGPNARSLSGHLRIFDWQRKEFHKELYTLQSDYVRTVQFSADSKRLYAGAYSLVDRKTAGEIRTYRTTDWALDWKAVVARGNPHEMSISPNGRDILVPDSYFLLVVDPTDGQIRGTKLKFRLHPDDEAEFRKIIK